MNTCPICGKEHDKSYGSGKFCSKHCRYVYIGKQTKNHVCNFPKIRNAVNKKPWGTWKCCWCEEIFETKLKLIEHKRLIHKNHPAWNKGLTKETDIRIKKACEKFHDKFVKGELKIKGHPHTKETKELLSKIRSEYLAKTENAGGFKDVGWYKIKNIENNEYTVRGLWEYNVAKKLNEQNILWIKNQYLYYFIDDIKKTYNPDFYLPILNEYIEVKGYFSEKDKLKMDAIIDQNPESKIRFLQYKEYSNFINDKCTIFDIPIYKFGKFNSNYKRKGIKEIKKDLHYCLICGKEIKCKTQKYCSHECATNGNKKVKISDQEKLTLLNSKSIQEIANSFNISYNAVKRWKKKFLINKYCEL